MRHPSLFSPVHRKYKDAVRRNSLRIRRAIKCNLGSHQWRINLRRRLLRALSRCDVKWDASRRSLNRQQFNISNLERRLGFRFDTDVKPTLEIARTRRCPTANSNHCAVPCRRRAYPLCRTPARRDTHVATALTENRMPLQRHAHTHQCLSPNQLIK